MQDLEKIAYLFTLKEVERMGRVGNRHETAAEHNWSVILLAEYFLKKIDLDIDELKVIKLLLYHELVEIEAGDTFVLDQEAKADQQEREEAARHMLVQKMPPELSKEYDALWKEYKDQETVESRFAEAIDKLEPMVHWLRDIKDWRPYGFTEEVLREKKEHYFTEFPAIHDFFERLLIHLKKKDYIG